MIWTLLLLTHLPLLFLSTEAQRRCRRSSRGSATWPSRSTAVSCSLSQSFTDSTSHAVSCFNHGTILCVNLPWEWKGPNKYNNLTLYIVYKMYLELRDVMCPSLIGTIFYNQILLNHNLVLDHIYNEGNVIHSWFTVVFHCFFHLSLNNYCM